MATTPPGLVSSMPLTTLDSKAGTAGGVATVGSETMDRLQLTLMYNCAPVSGTGLAQARADWMRLGRFVPGEALLLGDGPPVVGHRAEHLAAVELVLGARVGGDGERPADLAERRQPARRSGHVYLTVGCLIFSYVTYFLLLLFVVETARVARKADKLRAPKVFAGRARVPVRGVADLRQSARLPVSSALRGALDNAPSLLRERLAWLLPRALVHAGEAGFERIDAGGLPLQGGQQLPVVGVQLLQEGQVVGVHVLPGGQHLGVEVGPADQLGLGRLWG